MAMELNLVLLRLGIVFLSSLVFGIVRHRLHKPIGFGTFVFVALGSTTLSIIAVTIAPDGPLPLLGSIVSGIGFLGAGALIRSSDKVLGFTSAASIWIFAIFGLAIGIGEYLLGMITYGIAWLVIFIDMYLEHRSIGAYQKKLVITTSKLIPTTEFDRVFSGYTHKMLSIEVNKIEEKMIVIFLVEGSKAEINHLSKELITHPWFGSCKVE